MKGIEKLSSRQLIFIGVVLQVAAVTSLLAWVKIVLWPPIRAFLIANGVKGL